MNTNRLRSLKWFAWLLGLTLLLILIIMPLLTSALIRYDLMPPRFIKALDVFVQIQAVALGIFTIAWIFFFGSCIASFLNVVAWRVPRGRSILGSSHCPYCNSRLAFKDNLPIVGWLRNGGRCRTCRLPISPRYLVAEIILGSIFLMLALVQLNGGGINLPFRSTDGWSGFETLLFDPQWDLLLLLFFELTLLSSLFTFALVKSDGLRIPASLFLIPLVLGIGFPLLWPEMSLLSWTSEYRAATIPSFDLQTCITRLIGGVAGFATGWVLKSLITPKQLTSVQKIQLPQGMSIVGVFLGWQSVLSIAVIYLIITFACEIYFRHSGPAPPVVRAFQLNQFAKLTLATLLHLLSWRLQTAIPFWIGTHSSWITLLAGTSTVLVLALALRMLVSDPDTSDSSMDFRQM